MTEVAGEELSNIVLKTRTNDSRGDDAILYGLSRWVYHNTTDYPINGRITYRFDRYITLQDASGIRNLHKNQLSERYKRYYQRQYLQLQLASHCSMGVV